MSDEIYHSFSEGLRVPKVIHAVIAKGRDPQTGRSKTWVRVHTSKTDAKRTLASWTKYKFLDVRHVSAETEWTEE